MLLERANDFQITIARTSAEFESIAWQWHGLWQNDPRATPFQSPAWLIPWARHFTAGAFSCVAVRAGDQLVALLPTFKWRNPETGRDELLLLGTGISDYCDALALPDFTPEPVSAALRHLRKVFNWHLLDFQELRSDSPLLDDSDGGLQSVSPVLELPTMGEELGTVIPKAQLQNLAYYRRRAERIGTCQWEMADGESLDSILEELFELHSARWRQQGEGGEFEDGRVRAFHRDAAGGLLRIDVLRLYRLSLCGETAAVFYGFTSHRRTYYYLSGFNLKFANASPGTLIVGYAIEQATREGCTHFHFLRGAERYKYL